jgi:hypothetical protein
LNFRQAVQVNMKGAGEPIFEYIFPPSSDILGNIPKGLKASERMEFELFNRIAVHFEKLQFLFIKGSPELKCVYFIATFLCTIRLLSAKG